MKKTKPTKRREYVERGSEHIPQAVEDAIVEACKHSKMSESKLLKTLMDLHYRDCEFCVDLDAISRPGKETLPVEITLDRDNWVMIARAARHRKQSYGQVIAECVENSPALGDMDNEARGVEI
jgi:hypothetical protein